MLYFAYGSNMSINRLRKRVPSAIPRANGSISGFVLKFNKVSKDGSGKGNIEKTGNQHDVVHGVIYEFSQAEKGKLDKAEGLGHGYDEMPIRVSTVNGEIEVSTYYATHVDDSLKPYSWYLKYVIEGAKQNHLAKEYIEKLKEVDSIEDKNPQLHDT